MARSARPMDGTAAMVVTCSACAPPPATSKGGLSRRGFCRQEGPAEGSMHPDEEGLDRERHRELELLRLAPRRPYRLAGRLGGGRALAGRVLGELREPVDVDDGVLRPDGGDDEVAVPPLELLEHGQQLVPLRPALRSAQALFRLAAGELQHGDRFLRPLLRLGSALVDAGEDDLRPRGGVELWIEV